MTLFQLDDLTLGDDFETLLLDPLDAPGMVLLLDAVNSDCFPAQRIGWIGGPSPTRTYNLSLQTGTVPREDPTWDGMFWGNDTANGMVYENRGWKFQRPSGTAISNYLAATGGGTITPQLATTHFLLIVWARIGATGLSVPLLGSAGDDLATDVRNSFALYLHHKASNAANPGFFRIWDQAGARIDSVFNGNLGLEIGQLVQLGVHVVYGSPGNATKLHMYVNGAFTRTGEVGGMTAMRSNSEPLWVGASGANNQGAVTAHRLLVQRGFSSTAQAAGIVARDYQLNLARFQ